MAQAETFVPGTEILLDTSHKGGKDPNALLHLQHAKHGDSHLLLVPQPSLTDPNDPLRWSRFKKWLTLFNGLWYSFNGAVTGPIMAAGSSAFNLIDNKRINLVKHRLINARNDSSHDTIQYHPTKAHVRQWRNTCLPGRGHCDLDVRSHSMVSIRFVH